MLEEKANHGEYGKHEEREKGHGSSAFPSFSAVIKAY